MAAPTRDTSDGPAYQGDPVFKGCTRPAMFWGIPIVPFVIAFGTFVLLAVWISFLCLVPLPVVLLGMRQLVRNDDQAFRLLGLKLRFRFANRNAKFWKAAAYSPIPFAKRK